MVSHVTTHQSPSLDQKNCGSGTRLKAELLHASFKSRYTGLKAPKAST